MKHGKGTRLLALLACISIGSMTTACSSPSRPDSGPETSGTASAVPTAEATTVSSGEAATETTAAAETTTAADLTTTTVHKTTTTARKTTTTARKTTTTAQKEPDYPSKSKTSSIGFGMYGVAPDDGWTTTFDDFIQSDWCNTFFVDSGDLKEALPKAKKHNSQLFVGVGGTLWRYYGGTAKLIDRYQEEIDKIIETAKNTGAYDAFAGFYMDEPLLAGVTHQDLLKATKYMREATGNKKRVFICFSLAGIAPEQWTTETASPPITPETGKYITDAAFDVYGTWTDATKKNFQELTDKMLTRLGNRSDVRVWYIPPVMNYGGRMTEQNSITFLNGVLELLKKQKNPGGIMGYSYSVGLSETESIGNIGLGDMLKSDRKDRWTKLFDRIQEVGRGICTGKTFGK